MKKQQMVAGKKIIIYLFQRCLYYKKPVNKLLLICVLLSMDCMAQDRLEEFNGPFSSWANVKTRFGATGDGKHDDTKAIQTALDSLSDEIYSFNMGRQKFSAIYIPAGTYKITATLVLKGKLGVKIVGQDPSSTIFLWQGNEKDTMFWANGSAYFSFSRITLDPGGRKNMEGIGLHWKSIWNGPASMSYAPEQVEFSDLIFKAGFETGISGGTYGGGNGTGSNDSEITISRCEFNACSSAAIHINGFNALDYWIWYCKFQNCGIGIFSSSGNYHVYKSFFSGSLNTDVFHKNSYYTSVRFCYSENANAFSREDGGSGNPFKRIYEGNIVVGTKNLPIEYTHAGKITAIDNYFSVAAASNIENCIQFKNSGPYHFDVMDINNTYDGFKSAILTSVPGKIFRFSAAKKAFVVSAEQFRQNMPPTPPYKERIVAEVPVNASTTQIQDIINKASAFQKRAIVHFPMGRYALTKTLIVPANSDIQIAGDGYLKASIIMKGPAGIFENGTLLKINGPTSVSMRDIEFNLDNPENNCRAIVLSNIDQKGSSVILDQYYANNDTSLFIKDYDYTLFQKTNSFFTTGNYVSGGLKTQNGIGTMKVQCFGAQFAGLSLMGNASFFARDCWWEGGLRVPVNIKGSGNLTIDGSMIAPSGRDSGTTIMINEFNGKVAIMDMYLYGAINVKRENPGLQLLVWNINFYSKKRPFDFVGAKSSYKGLFGGATVQCSDNKDPQCAYLISTENTSVNVTAPDDFVQDISREFRAATPVEYISKPYGISNFYLSRVTVNDRFKTGIAFIR